MTKGITEEIPAWVRQVKVRPQLVVAFTRQLATMLQSSVPILVALDTLSNQVEDPHFGEVIRRCCEKIETGGALSRAMGQFPTVFPNIYVTMVQIGESTGSLDAALDSLALWLERDEALRQRLRAALTYPVLVFSLAFLMTLAIFYTVMPTFVSIFSDMKMELPAITRVMMFITKALASPPDMLIAIGVVVALWTNFRRWVVTRKGRRSFYRFCLNIPVLGGMLLCGGLARYCSSMEALLRSGMTLIKSLRLAAEASGNPLLETDAVAMVASVSEGEPVAAHMERFPDLYPVTLKNMIASGEEVSQLPEMFARTAAFYEVEMNYRVDALGATLEPVLLGLVSIIIGSIVMSIFLPLYSYIGQLGA